MSLQPLQEYFSGLDFGVKKQKTTPKSLVYIFCIYCLFIVYLLFISLFLYFFISLFLTPAQANSRRQGISNE
jgi:hypothetical protein